MTRHILAVSFLASLTSVACQFGGGSDYERPPDTYATGGASNDSDAATGGLGGSGNFDPANPSMTYEFRDPSADLSDCTVCVNETVPFDTTPGLCCHGREYFKPYGVCSCTAPDGG